MQPWALLLTGVPGWINRKRQQVIELLLEMTRWVQARTFHFASPVRPSMPQSLLALLVLAVVLVIAASVSAFGATNPYGDGCAERLTSAGAGPARGDPWADSG